MVPDKYFTGQFLFSSLARSLFMHAGSKPICLHANFTLLQGIQIYKSYWASFSMISLLLATNFVISSGVSCLWLISARS